MRQPPPGLLPPQLWRSSIAGETTKPALALSWSGGKDSALALWTLRRQRLEPRALITTVTDAYHRISMHGVRRELLACQAGALDIPLVEVVIPPACVNDVYEARMAQAFAAAPLSDVDAVAFGDLFLRTSAPTAKGALPPPASAPSSRSGGATRRSWRRPSSTPASRRSSSVSTRASSTPPSPGAPTTSGC